MSQLLETVNISTSCTLYIYICPNELILIPDLYSAVKMARLKQAKDEAEREVMNYRSQMEADYQKSISEVLLACIYIYITCTSIRFIFNTSNQVHVVLIHVVVWEFRLNGEKARLGNRSKDYELERNSVESITGGG